MSTSGNGAKPTKTAEQVATELRGRLEDKLGTERTDAIWQDPANVQEVVEGESEAADVAEIMLKAWQDLAVENEPATPKRRSRFRRGLQIALIAAVAVWAVSITKRVRSTDEPV